MRTAIFQCIVCAGLLFAALASASPPAPAKIAKLNSKPATATYKQIPCSAIASGSANVLIEGKPAGRLGDGSCVVALQGSTNVFINGLPR